MSMPSSGFEGNGAPVSFATVGRMSIIDATPCRPCRRNAAGEAGNKGFAHAAFPGHALAPRKRPGLP